MFPAADVALFNPLSLVTIAELEKPLDHLAIGEKLDLFDFECVRECQIYYFVIIQAISFLRLVFSKVQTQTFLQAEKRLTNEVPVRLQSF